MNWFAVFTKLFKPTCVERQVELVASVDCACIVLVSCENVGAFFVSNRGPSVCGTEELPQ